MIQFDGYCPECLLHGEQVLMQLNNDGYLECPQSRLQIVLQGDCAGILRWRGNGQVQPAIKAFETPVQLTETMKLDTEEAIPDEAFVLQDSCALEWYLHEVYDHYKAYKRHQFNAKDPVFERQRQLLQDIKPTQWQQLFESFLRFCNTGVSINVHHHPEFKKCQQLLLSYGVVFEFNWHAWHRGWVNLRNPKFSFHWASLLELSMYLSAIILSEPFDEGSIEFYFNNKTIERIIMAMEQRTGVQVLTLD